MDDKKKKDKGRSSNAAFKKEQEEEYRYKEQIPYEDIDMLREKNDPNSNSAYQGDNSYDDQ